MRPADLPDIPRDALWRARDLPTTDAFAVDLDPASSVALESDVREMVRTGRSAEAVEPGELPVGELAPALAEVGAELLHGRGLVLLRGFPVGRLSTAEIELFFWAVGLRMGRPVSQSVMGDRLGHIVDVTDRDPTARAYRNRSELTPHSDPADLLSFLCIRPARSGGVSRFVSSLTIHEEIRRTRPDLLARLYRGFRYHRLGEQPPGRPDITPHRIPVFSVCEGVVSCRYVRQYIEVAADEDPSIEITEADREALELFESLAADPELHVELTLAGRLRQQLHGPPRPERLHRPRGPGPQAAPAAPVARRRSTPSPRAGDPPLRGRAGDSSPTGTGAVVPDAGGGPVNR